MMKMLRLLLVLLFIPLCSISQIRWATDGNAFYKAEDGGISKYSLPANTKSIFISAADLTPSGQNKPLEVNNYSFSQDQQLVLIFSNTSRVWRLNTKGDYWVLSLKTKTLKKLGINLPTSSLMFAKISPDGTKAAYVSEHNIYAEDLTTSIVQPLTSNGTRKLINGTFDWVYEEEFACRDGFQWSPDSKYISYWQIDANRVRDFYMINNTDSVYSKIVPVEYPVIGQSPSPAKIGVVSLATQNTKWLSFPGDPQEHYIPRIEWMNNGQILVQRLNRAQNESAIFMCSPVTGDAKQIYFEKDNAWIDIYSPWEDVYALDFRHYFNWLAQGKEFLWTSEKDGWRHLYRISIDGTKETLVTKGDYDVMNIARIDEKNGVVYFSASPANATQSYLYKTTLDGKGKLELVSPASLQGTHEYNVSPEGKFAFHSFSNAHTKPLDEIVSLKPYKALVASESIEHNLVSAQDNQGVEFFKIKTEEGVEMDGWMVKPANFDRTKKYPILFFVYTEPWGANVKDSYGVANNYLFKGNLAAEGYVYITIDNRGTPVPKGSGWRKSVYRKMGLRNIRDQALGAREILKWPWIDADRVAVWGWSGGGSATLNLMFQFPEIYKTGIAVAAVSNLLTYDNIYQERYTGLPKDNMSEIIAGSPLTYAKNLQGNLLIVHGTGDDNVHYSNAEMLLNELIRYNKQFQFMAYPNRSHGIYEGAGTREHLRTLFTEYLRKHCPPGAK